MYWTFKSKWCRNLDNGGWWIIWNLNKFLTLWFLLSADVSIDVPDTLDLSALRAMGQQPGEELLPEVAPPPLMTPDVEVKGILGSHGNEEDDSLYSPLLCQSVCHFWSSPSSLVTLLYVHPCFLLFFFSAFSVFMCPCVALLFVYFCIMWGSYYKGHILLVLFLPFMSWRLYIYIYIMIFAFCQLFKNNFVEIYVVFRAFVNDKSFH